MNLVSWRRCQRPKSVESFGDLRKYGFLIGVEIIAGIEQVCQSICADWRSISMLLLWGWAADVFDVDYAFRRKARARRCAVLVVLVHVREFAVINSEL
jgi:hypothetical protein